MSDVYKSATLKLTAWYLALVMMISLIFSAVVYHFATDTLASGLTRQQARIYREFPVFSNNPFFVRDTDIAVGSHTILSNLIYFNLVVLVGAGFASYWLARRTLQPIEASNERQRRFVADASHELRTPLTALKMDSEVALLDPAASKAALRQTLQSNLEEADKLTLLLNNLLRLSQLDSGSAVRTFAPLTASHIAQRAVAEVTSRAHAKHINLSNTVGTEPAYGDLDSLAQLLVTLLDNAIKFSPDGSAVGITASTQDGMTTISVSDHGAGIEPEALKHVFDRFYRADKARVGSEGYGLGLSIAKQIADLHHGTITLRSVAGRGTTAIVRLPQQPTGQAA
jgi:two-component system, OmpR family, sensor histidine kinase CiaH